MPADSWDDVRRHLPPLPTPDRAALRRERAIGRATVLGTTLFFVALTHGVGVVAGRMPAWASGLVLGLIYCEAAIALFSIVVISWKDPGVIERNERNCLPLPPPVRAAIETGQLGALAAPGANITEGDDTYCVRCFVWRRRARGGGHHCRTCGRCVAHFDHHCGVLGFCIAGTPCLPRGNILLFYGLILAANAGALTTIVAVLTGVALRWGPHAIAIAFGAAFALACAGFAIVAAAVAGVRQCQEAQRRGSEAAQGLPLRQTFASGGDYPVRGTWQSDQAPGY